MALAARLGRANAADLAPGSLYHGRMGGTPSGSDGSVYAASLAYVAELLSTLGVDSAEAFRTAGLDDPAALRPPQRIPVSEAVGLMRTIDETVGRPALHLELGMQVPVMAHSTMGNAIISSSDVGSALGLACRYLNLLVPAVQLVAEPHETGRRYLLHLDPVWWEAEHMVTEGLLGAIVGNLLQMLGEVIRPVLVTFAYAPPQRRRSLSKLARMSGRVWRRKKRRRLLGGPVGHADRHGQPGESASDGRGAQSGTPAGSSIALLFR